MLTTAQAPPRTNEDGTSEYAAPRTCAQCHARIAETYRLTGMGRSFSRPNAENVPVAGGRAEYVHEPSESTFQVLRRGSRFLQRRHQTDANGRETNVMEKEIDFIIGSGNHARTFLSLTPRKTLLELPLGWYADKGGEWAMNPGYDRPDHEGFRREISYDCMSCHNGYPRIPEGNKQAFAEPVYLDPLPEGIDCQRCHGPGKKHVDLAGSGKATREQLRSAIVNPAKLSRERREEICIQCHLETTSFPLPNSLLRYDRGPFDYRPGEPLGNYWLFFDHAPGTGREDKFEIVNAVYRLRQSRCFLQSKGVLECSTCHNVHDIPRGEKAAKQYEAACRKCHGPDFAQAVSSGKHTTAADCAGCHMPKRRTEDVVHAVATDHLIQRHKPEGDLLAARPERQEQGSTAYRGEVALYYPADLPASPTRELYTSLAQVIEGSNIQQGTERLSAALQRFPFARAEFFFHWGEALRKSGKTPEALKAYAEALRRDPKLVVAQLGQGKTLRQAGRTDEAVGIMERAAEAVPKNAAVWNELGLAYQSQGRMPDAVRAFTRAVSLNVDLPEPHSNLGTALLSSGDRTRAEAELREAIRIQPDYVDAHANLANLLAGTGAFAEARRQFERALRLRPNDATLRYDFAVALGRAQQFDEARVQLEAALKSDAQFSAAHELLAKLLIAQNQPTTALPHYREWMRLEPESEEATLGLGRALALTGAREAAMPYLTKAAASKSAAIREEAARLLLEFGSR